MQRLIYAFRFIKACLSLATRQSQLRKPWFYLWMGGISLSVLWFLPLGAVVALVGVNPQGMVLIGLISILLLFSLLVWGEVTALETCRAFDALIHDQEQPEPGQPRQAFSRWQDVFLWVLILPGLEVIRLLSQAFRPKQVTRFDWLGASYLMLPALSIEDLSLAEAMERLKQLVRDHLLRFHPDLVGISPLAGVVQWSFILAGGFLGFWVGLMMADPATAGVLSRLLAAAIGVLLAGFLGTAGIFFSSYNRACYYSTLYHWAQNVAAARSTGDASQGRPPAILSQVMRKTISNKKE